MYPPIKQNHLAIKNNNGSKHEVKYLQTSSRSTLNSSIYVICYGIL